METGWLARDPQFPTLRAAGEANFQKIAARASSPCKLHMHMHMHTRACMRAGILTDLRTAHPSGSAFRHSHLECRQRSRSCAGSARSCASRGPDACSHSGHDSRVVYRLVWCSFQHAHSYCRSSLKIRRATNVKPQFLKLRKNTLHLLYRESRAKARRTLRVPLVRTTVIPPGTRLQPKRTPTRLLKVKTEYCTPAVRFTNA